MHPFVFTVVFLQTTNLLRDLEKYEKSEASVDRAQTLLPGTNFDFKGKLKDCLKGTGFNFFVYFCMSVVY